jgi:GntR family transcriptional repressor for pyruvate dehydrogenase complex
MKRIERVSMTDEAVKGIRSLIREDRFKPGDKLPTEIEFCEQLGVGRSTIREAFRVLQALGVIEIQHGKGAYVKNKADQDSTEAIRRWFIEKEAEVGKVMEVRMAIEPLASKLAILHGKESQISQIRAIHSAFEEAVEKNDIIEMATIDEIFHNAIVEASDNPLLVKIGKLLSNSLMEYRTRSFAVAENTSHALAAHSRILAAILVKDEKAVVAATLSHLEISLEDINRVMELEQNNR